jgi:large conductance mechanosensitive channel
MFKGFRDFLMRGNVIDLAVAVIIGAAFGKIVSAFVADLINPLLAALVGKPDFSALVFNVNGGIVKYGDFLNEVISFVLIAAVVYFVIVVPMNYAMSKLKKPAPIAEIMTKTCGQCVSEIPLAAVRCKFCTQAV